MVGPYRVLNLLHLTALTAKLEDYTTAPQDMKNMKKDNVAYVISLYRRVDQQSRPPFDKDKGAHTLKDGGK